MLTNAKDRRLRLLSPKRNTTKATTSKELTEEQLEHFGIDAQSEYGQILATVVQRMYDSQGDIEDLWRLTLDSMNGLDQTDKIKRFNAKKFLSFQLAKILDSLQHPFRKSYQSLGYQGETSAAKGPYPVFDNVTALFSATPVITRTATYIFACAEWIADAFRGEELMLEIYSRLLNPTSVCLANHIVDLEAGPYASEYMAWNFNSGMAAIDSALAHLLGRDDILITSRNIYGGAYQLIHDWYAKPGNLEIAVETFDGYTAQEFAPFLQQVKDKYQQRLEQGRKIYVYLESPSNPQGYVLDVAGISKVSHDHNLKVILDSTVATPFLYRPFNREDVRERPDFVIHSYTKDLSGCGAVIAGCVIGRNEEMFIPKGQSVGDISWDQTMFWNVYYVKGAFLNADAAFEVMQGMKTLTVRMLRKCINTQILADFLNSHPDIDVQCNAIETNFNSNLREQNLYLGLSAPLFTFDMGKIDQTAFQKFFDALSPTFGHMISLGQSNTIVSCPALTTHSELDEKALAEAGMTPTTVRCAVGDEDPIDLIRHFVFAARGTIDLVHPGYSDGFPKASEVRDLIRDRYTQVHADHVNHQLARFGQEEIF
ncbi:MAG: aminotransferase class I/II-fold pyridoxal phosphate-dependent enzyme [Planctomycetota bacterium]